MHERELEPVDYIRDKRGNVVITVSGRLSPRQIEQTQTAYLRWLHQTHPEVFEETEL